MTTSSAKSLSSHASWTEMQPQLFHIQRDAFECCCADGAGPTTQRGSTRSTPGCGNLDGPSLARAASQWPRLKDPKEVPARCCQTRVGRKAGPDYQVTGIYMVYTWYIHGIYMVYTWYIHGIYMVYTTYIPAVSETDLLCTFELLSCATMLRACISNASNFHSFPF